MPSTVSSNRLAGGDRPAGAGDEHLAVGRHLALLFQLRRLQRRLADLLDDDGELLEVRRQLLRDLDGRRPRPAATRRPARTCGPGANGPCDGDAGALDAGLRRRSFHDRRCRRAVRHVERERRRRVHRHALVVGDVEQVEDVDRFLARLQDEARLVADDHGARLTAGAAGAALARPSCRDRSRPASAGCRRASAPGTPATRGARRRRRPSPSPSRRRCR